MKNSPVEYVNNFLVAGGNLVFGNDVVKKKVLAPEIADSWRVSAGVKAFQQRFDEPHACSSVSDKERPVFVLSAGWGSGSTLIQRLLISSGKLIVWGEPVDEAAPIHRLAQSVAAVRESWPPGEHFRPDWKTENLTDAWIANFAPDMQCFQSAHRRFVLEWLGTETRKAGIERWGLKEVRLTIDHAVYLKWLFPHARFVFVYRDIYGSYLSIRRRPWTSIWPDYPATPIIPFAHHWNHLLRGFIDRHEEVGGMLVRYEDITAGKFDMEALADYVGVAQFDKKLLQLNVGGRSRNRRPLILPERLMLDAIAGNLRRELGYC
ncbi:MAG: sulfotransferase [Granulosicoccus sp.]